MRLYDRDYTILTAKEIEEWDKLKKEEYYKLGKLKFRKPKFSEYPKAVRHYQSLFPNNYLDVIELRDVEKLNSKVNSFIELVKDSTSSERTLLNYINNNKVYPIIGSILKSYDFGHHEAYLFPEFQLGNSYQVDYLLVGKSSGGYEFVFVELEHPNNKIFLKDGSQGEAFRKGLIQVNDWKRWLEINFSSLQETFKKYLNPKIDHLPEEFLIQDHTRYHYVVVAGKRVDFELNKEKKYRTRRQEIENKIKLLHYDNLYDMAKRVIGENNY